MIDWPGMMRLGLGHLRLLPYQFWDLTPVELMLMVGITPSGTSAMTRARLDALCAKFPDT